MTTFGGATSLVHSGSLGVFPGTAITGSYELEGGTTASESTSATCAADRVTAHEYAAALPCTTIPSDLSGLTYPGDVYCSAPGTFSTMGYGVVDGNNDPTSRRVFQAATKVVTGGYSSIVFANGGLAKNVYWAVGSSAAIGPYSSFAGTILAHASVRFGHGSVITGQTLAGGEVYFESGSTLSSAYPAACSAIAPSVISVPLGCCQSFAVLAGSTAAFRGVPTLFNSGSVGISPGTDIIGSYSGNDALSSSLDDCAADRVTAYNAAVALICTHMTSSDLSGLVLLGGVYMVGSGILALNGNDDPSSKWVFQAAKNVVTGGSSTIVMIKQGLASNVYWAVGSSATIGLSSTFAGTILAYASVTFGHGSVMTGRALAGDAVTFESGSTVSLPTLSFSGK